jgi:hypothetical protein
MAIIFARTIGVQLFVFVETSDNVSNRFVFWAESEKSAGRLRFEQRKTWL